MDTHRHAGQTLFKNPLSYLSLLGIAILLLLPLISSGYILNMLCLILLFASTGAAWNILGGYAGQVSLGHGIFFGIGAYTSTLLLIHFNISPWIGMIVGGLLSVLVGYIIGLGVFKLRGHYFAITTIAFSSVLLLLVTKFSGLTGGAQGLSVPYQTSLLMLQFSDKMLYYYIFLAFMLGMIFLVKKIEASRLGYYMIAIGQDEEAAKAVGISIPRVKHSALAISAFCTSIMGTLYAQYMYFINPDQMFPLSTSIKFSLFAIIGGLGTVLGPIIGAFIMQPIVEFSNELFGSGLPGLNYAIYGLILVLVIIFIPNGVTGVFSKIYHFLFNRFQLKKTATKGERHGEREYSQSK